MLFIFTCLRGRAKRVREQESKTAYICRFTSPKPSAARTGSGRSQEPGVPSKSPTWVVGV